MKKRLHLAITFLSSLLLEPSSAQQRFPKPEFETGYVQPSPTTPEPRLPAWEYVDILVLVGVLALAAWLIFDQRSRRGIVWLSVFSLAYFGFFREGCVCSIGAIQNVTLTLFRPEYAISLTALAFFIIPLISTLFFGRTFCAAACPLGVVQDLLIYKPVPLSPVVNKTLGIIPYIYLGLAVLLAATGTDFIICRYDPFVGFFRLDGPFLMIVMGISFLLVGLFIARPYCRFLCPYGVLLSWISQFSKRHLTITPAECIDCKLCAKSCPFDAIESPTIHERTGKTESDTRRFLLYILLLPTLAIAGGILGRQSHIFLSKAHPDIQLAELLITHPETKNDPEHIDVQTFLASGKTMETLVEEAKAIRQEYYYGSMWFGGFMGLVIGLMLINQVTFRERRDFEPNKGNCFSCGRCMDYCPVGKTD